MNIQNKNSSNPVAELDFNQKLKKSYIDYSMSVIVGRAIPDARDGCKPVQRRILYAMIEGDYLWDKPYKKSAKIVGDVLGKYHPHGDVAIYDALVRMAQDFSMSIKLVDGQGNFGSIDGDPAASMRYTESRLAKISKYLLQDCEKECVSWVQNYDRSLEIPSVLPASFPNLLVNGANGIAVGMATSIPTHNLGEVVDALCAFIDNQDISTAELMNYLKGPDFPTGGTISDSSLYKIYNEGRGSFFLSGHVEIENNYIVITSIPYQVNKARLVEQIADLADEGVLDDISEVRDESNLQGIRVVVEAKRGSNLEVLRRNLLIKTLLRTSVHVNMLALNQNIPKQLNLRELLSIFLNFRDEIIINRTNYLLRNARARAHILCGQLLSLAELDAVIKCIRGTSGPEEARHNLSQMRWNRSLVEKYIELDNTIHPNAAEVGLSEVQIKSIMEMRLQSLTSLEQRKISNELEEFRSKMENLQLLLDSQQERFNLIKADLQQIKREFGQPRRTEIKQLEGFEGEFELITPEDCVVTISHRDYLKRVSLETYRTQKRGGRGKYGASESDPITHMCVANTHSLILIFSTDGYAYSIPVYKIPEATPNTVGRSVRNLIPFRSSAEKIMAAMPITSMEGTLVFVTSKGFMRRNAINDFLGIRRNGKLAIDLDETEKLAAVLIASEEDEVLITSSDGKSARIKVNEVRIFNSRSSRGVLGMSLSPGQSIVSVTLLDGQENTNILTVTERGFGKRTSVAKYRRTRRGAKGVTTTVVNADTGPVVGAYRVNEGDELLLMNNKGQIIRSLVSEIRLTDRIAKGVYLAKLDEGDYITHTFIIKEKIEEE